MKTKNSFKDTKVRLAFEAFPDAERQSLLAIRDAIFRVAAHTPGVGDIEETLKWGQPAYLTPQTKSGSTIRLGLPKQGWIGIYTHCQTSIMSEFKSLFPDEFDIEGNRAVHFTADEDLPMEQLELLFASALTYHLK